MRRGLLVLLTVGCAPGLVVSRHTPAGLADHAVIALAASGPYASDLIAGVRARISHRVKVESCVIGCPAVGLYASLSLTPGPHEGRVLRSCQAEVYTGDSWATPREVRRTLSQSLETPEACIDAISALLLEPATQQRRLRLDDRGPLAGPVRAITEGRLDDARGQLEALSNESTGAWYDLSLLFESRGQFEEARRCASEVRRRGAEGWMLEALLP